MNRPIGHKQQGLTLVEILVALVISLVLMIGVVQIFVANKVTYRTQEGLARLQENGRYATHRIAKSARQAGFFGCSGMQFINPKVIANPPPTDLASITSATAVGGENNVLAGNTYGARVGTDVITLRGGGDEGIGLTGSITQMSMPVSVTTGYNKFATNDFVLITDCQAAELFKASAVSGSSIAHDSTTNTSATFSQPYGPDAVVLKPFIHTYFVKDTGRTNTAGKTIFALYMRNINGTDNELVEGISDMQVLYGVDQDGNRAADIYMSANDVNSALAWDKVVSARISLLIDSVDNALQVQDSKTLSGGVSIATDPDDFRLRQEFTRIVSIRNRTL